MFKLHVYDYTDDTITESKRADRVINAINIKSSYSIAALYISLLDSSNDEDGPPTHHQLAYELKRIGTYYVYKSHDVYITLPLLLGYSSR